MLSVDFSPSGGRVSAVVGAVAVYLDNFALIRFATGDAVRRQRLVQCLRGGADLLFSVTNACEILGPQSPHSVAAIRAMLDEIGNAWLPVENNVALVVQREQAGQTGFAAYECLRFARDCFIAQTAAPASKGIIGVSDASVGLGKILDWLPIERESILAGMAELDEMLQERIAHWRRVLRNAPARPPMQFDPRKPATFTFDGLLHGLVSDRGFQLKKGDGADFCHAVIAAAFAQFAALDKGWKRRVESLRKPHQLSTVYYETELDQLVDDLEASIR